MKYTINKGEFYSSPIHFGIHLRKTKEKFKVKFSKECLYTPIDWENDYNKLIGWSYGLHHKNSIRIGWRPCNNSAQIELCIYIYENGVRKISDNTLIINVDTEYEFTLEYEVDFDNRITLSYPRPMNGYKQYTAIRMYTNIKPCMGYNLYPYFGGNNPSPNKMTIELNRL